MTTIEFHILNSYDPVFYHHRGLTSQSDLLSDFQSGFRKKHSTGTALVYLTDYILERMDRQMITGAVFIDLKKAFNLVDLECLLFKPEHYGVRGSSLDWFRNYLTTRTYLTMLMLRVGGSLRGVLQRVTPPTEPCISNYITEEYLK